MNFKPYVIIFIFFIVACQNLPENGLFDEKSIISNEDEFKLLHMDVTNFENYNQIVSGLKYNSTSIELNLPSLNYYQDGPNVNRKCTLTLDINEPINLENLSDINISYMSSLSTNNPPGVTSTEKANIQVFYKKNINDAFQQLSHTRSHDNVALISDFRTEVLAMAGEKSKLYFQLKVYCESGVLVAKTPAKNMMNFSFNGLNITPKYNF